MRKIKSGKFKDPVILSIVSDGIIIGTSICISNNFIAMDVGLCDHGMARPQVADGGMASYMEGSCE